jgi:hypothetical protein
MDTAPTDLTIQICGTPAPYGPIIGPGDVKLAALHNMLIGPLFSPPVVVPLRCSTPPPM